MNIELHEAIEQLYEVFAKYPANFNMDGSPMYQELAQWNRALTIKPLRHLSEDDLRIYYFKAMTTLGDVNDFKHFLPRILELLSVLPFDFDEWVTLDKLKYGNYETWPTSEKEVIRQFLFAFWQKLITEKSDLIDALFDGYFPAIANVYPDFKQLLAMWLEIENEQAWQRLAAFVCRNDRKILKQQVLPGNNDLATQGQLFLEWLKDVLVINKLKQVAPSKSYPYLDLELAPIIKQLEQ